ncbi:low affinity immunoglobulin gamma Fc region receptor III-A-like [Eleutherodactylus coqui]|uniref:low affinity immunoglobulin gamma Fc region receptor III-A-like n=1 Tax=Eleutherodactylus coqui TaxID=57060 RepID=UPI0034622346
MSTEMSVLLLLLVLIQEGAAIRPAVTFSPNYRKIFTTESITMTCDGGSTIGGGPNYIWYKDYSPVYNGKSYIIQSAETSDSGSYRCQTRPGEISDPAGLEVVRGYVILQTPLYVYEGDEIHIRCHQRLGYYVRRTRFYKDNILIRDWTYTAEYYIGNVDGTTSGTYRCEKQISGPYIDGDAVSVSAEDSCRSMTVVMFAFVIQQVSTGENAYFEEATKIHRHVDAMISMTIPVVCLLEQTLQGLMDNDVLS